MNCLGKCIVSLFAASLANTASAVIFHESGDPAFHSSTPGDNSGWQYEGKFNSFLGVPIAPHFFITAKHIGGSVGDTLNFHGDIYTTISFTDVGTTDLRIWEVDHAKPFPVYAPLSSGANDLTSTAVVMGRGTQRGAEVFVGAESKGWKWGPSDDVQRWGRNQVALVFNQPGLGVLLQCDFDKPGLAGECHLSVGDSGGGLFVLEDGLWRLAGINYAVDGPFRENASEAGYNAALFDAGGLQYQNGLTWVSLPEQALDISSSFYSSRVSASLAAIYTITGGSNVLAAESFADWQHAYFSPAEIALPAENGVLGDSDNDGIANLLEFALNLDPSFNEQAVMLPGTGLRGLPLVKTESISGVDYLTIEFVRRTVASGSGLTYEPQFCGDLAAWSISTNETVVSINSRWERVKVVDSQPVNASDKRFARLMVSIED